MRFQLKRLLLPSLALLALANALLLFVHRVMTNGDNLDYLFIAGSILAGDWAEPFSWRFPVGYPFLLAGFAKLAGIAIHPDPLTISTAGVYGVKLLGVATAPLAVWAVWRWSRLVMPGERSALIVTALFATTQHLAPLYSMIGAEAFFILFSWAALERWERACTELPGCREWLVGAIGFAMLAILFRQIGMALPLGGILWIAVSGSWRRGRGARCMALWAVLLLGIGVGIMILSNPTHLEHLSDGPRPVSGASGIISSKLDLLASNAYSYCLAIPHLLLPKVFGENGLLTMTGLSFLEWPTAILLYGLLSAGLLGVWSNRRPGSLTAAYMLVSSAVILLWPYRDARFFAPLLPGLWMLVIVGYLKVVGIAGRASHLARAAGTTCIILLLTWQLATNAYAGIKNIRAMWEFRSLPAWHPSRYELTGETDFADHLACGLWLGEHTGSGSVVYGEKPSFLALSSGRRAYYMSDLLHGMDEGGLPEMSKHFVVVDLFPETAGYGQPKLKFMDYLVRQSPPAYELVHEAPRGARIYRHRDGKEN